MNVGNYTKQLSDWMEYKRYSPESIKNYVSCLGKFLTYFEKKATKPSEISAEKIKKFLTQFKETNTHRAYLCSIKLFYSKIGNQPDKLDKVEYPKSSKKLPIVLSVDEIQRMFNVCDNLKHKVILALLYSCGLRVSELINLFIQKKHIIFILLVRFKTNLKKDPSHTLPNGRFRSSEQAFVFVGHF